MFDDRSEILELFSDAVISHIPETSERFSTLVLKGFNSLAKYDWDTYAKILLKTVSQLPGVSNFQVSGVAPGGRGLVTGDTSSISYEPDEDRRVFVREENGNSVIVMRADVANIIEPRMNDIQNELLRIIQNFPTKADKEKPSFDLVFHNWLQTIHDMVKPCRLNSEEFQTLVKYIVHTTI